MFEFMHKYRVLILAVMMFGLLGFGAWGAIESLFLGPTNEVVGTFDIPGADEPVEVWSEEYWELVQALARDNPQRLNILKAQAGLQETDPRLLAWDMLVLAKAAEAAGAAPTLAATESFIRDELRRAGVSLPDDEPLPPFLEGDLERQRMFNAVKMYRMQFMQDPVGKPFEDLYESYKNQYATISAKVAVIDQKAPESFEMDLSKEEDKKKLKEWFDVSGRGIAQRNKKLANVDLEVVYVRLKDRTIDEFKAEFDKNWAALTADMEVTEEDRQARYNAQTYTYHQLSHAGMEAEGREHDHSDDTKDEDYEYLKEKGHLDREIKVARLMKKLRDDVHETPDKLREAAAKYGFAVAELKESEQSDLAEQPDFGSLGLSSTVWGQGVARLPKEDAEPTDADYKLGALLVNPGQQTGGLQADVFDDPSSMIGLVRMTAHNKERIPEFDEIVVKVKEEWQNTQARDDLLKATTGMEDEIKDWILALPEVAESEKVKEARKRRDQRVEDRIKAQELDRANEEHKDKIEGIETAETMTFRNELEEELKPHYLKGLEAVAKEKGFELKDIGPIQKAAGTMAQYPEGLDRRERVSRLLRWKGLLNNISFKEGVACMPSPLAKLGVAAVLTEKKEPGREELLMYPDRVVALMGSSRTQPDRNWNYEVLKQPGFFDIEAEQTDAYIAEVEKSEREKAARKAKRQARKNKERQEKLQRQLERQRKELEADQAKDPDEADSATPDKKADDKKADDKKADDKKADDKKADDKKAGDKKADDKKAGDKKADDKKADDKKADDK